MVLIVFRNVLDQESTERIFLDGIFICFILGIVDSYNFVSNDNNELSIIFLFKINFIFLIKLVFPIKHNTPPKLLHRKRNPLSIPFLQSCIGNSAAARGSAGTFARIRKGNHPPEVTGRACGSFSHACGGFSVQVRVARLPCLRAEASTARPASTVATGTEMNPRPVVIITRTAAPVHVPLVPRRSVPLCRGTAPGSLLACEECPRPQLPNWPAPVRWRTRATCLPGFRFGRRLLLRRVPSSTRKNALSFPCV